MPLLFAVGSRQIRRRKRRWPRSRQAPPKCKAPLFTNLIPRFLCNPRLIAFGRQDLKTLDPNQWARLKIEYERQCYQRAERAVRERLRLLQTASRCDGQPGR
jgi:hypothetical protein